VGEEEKESDDEEEKREGDKVRGALSSLFNFF
jgi:hypothetical protein